jgi:hypothetical protein
MFGLASPRKARDAENPDAIAKLFFDSFSKRVEGVEHEMQDYGSKIARLKLDLEQGRISDLVLLERLQRLEGQLNESLDWVRKLADRILALKVVPASERESRLPIVSESDLENRGTEPVSVVISPSGQVGSIRSLTTPTELSVLTLLGEQGAKSAPEIGRFVGRSREHTARLMKRLLDEGYVLRDQSRIPYRYTLSERVRQGMVKKQVSTIQTGKSSEGDRKQQQSAETVSTVSQA